MFKVKVFNEYGNEVGTYNFNKREDAWEHAEAMNLMHYSTTVLEEKENKVMTTEKIIESIVKEVKNKGFNVEHKHASKNGVELNGLALKCDDAIACIVYVDDSVKQIQEKKNTLEKVVEEVIESLEKAKDRQPKINEFMDLRYILDNLYIGLQRRTSETIVKKIYKDFEDYEAYLYISKFTDEQAMSAKVTPYLLEQLGDKPVVINF